MEGKTLWENLKKGVEQGIKTITEKTEELTEMGRLKLEIMSLKREIEKDFVELGGRIYQLMKENKGGNLTQNSEIQALVEKVKTEEKKLDEYNQKWEKMTRDEPKGQGNVGNP
jgi:hypothetical protein